MDIHEAVYRAAKVTESVAVIANTVNGAGSASYQPERERVEFYVNDLGTGQRKYHFRFECGRRYVIRDMFMNAEMFATDRRDFALAAWASYILDYAV